MKTLAQKIKPFVVPILLFVFVWIQTAPSTCAESYVFDNAKKQAKETVGKPVTAASNPRAVPVPAGAHENFLTNKPLSAATNSKAATKVTYVYGVKIIETGTVRFSAAQRSDIAAVLSQVPPKIRSKIQSIQAVTGVPWGGENESWQRPKAVKT